MTGWLILGGIAITAICLTALGNMIRKHGAITLGWRWFTGHSLSGYYHTDAGWFAPATKVMHPTGRAHPFWHLPRATRAVIRTLGTTWAAFTTWGLIIARTLTLEILAGLALAGIGGGAYAAYRGAQTYRLRREVTGPLAAALAPLVKMPHPATHKAIRLKPGYQSIREGEIGSVTLPPHFRGAPDERAAIEHLISSRVPVDTEHEWRTRESPQRLVLKASPRPPSLVRFADSLELMTGCDPGRVFIGLDRYSRPFYGSFVLDDPHWGFSCGSGRGKSTFLHLVTAQVFHQDTGATATAIDPKMTSFEPLAGVPGFTLANDPRDIGGMWAAITDYKGRMMDRLGALQSDPTLTFPIDLLLLDEINQFAAMSAAHWRTIKESGDPTTPPIWMDIASVFWMGRAANCHGIAVGQRLDDKATGGIGLRDSLGFRGLAGYRTQQWDMLFNVRPRQRSQKPKGRWIFSDGQTETWAQCCYGTPQEVRDWALEGRRPGLVSVATPPVAPSPTRSGSELATCDIVTGLDAGAAATGLKVAAFRKRRERAGGQLPGEFRRGNQPAWTRDDLAAWAAVDATTERQEA